MVRMYHQGHSSRRIAKSFGVSRDTILRTLRGVGCKIRPPGFKKGTKPPLYVKRDIPDPWKDVDAAYVFGVLIGDASIKYNKVKRGKTPSRIELETPDDEFATIFSNAVESAFGIEVKDHSGNHNPYVQANSVDFGRSYDRFKWRTETWRVPKQFFDAPREIKIALCQGKFDSDGGVDRGAIVIKAIHKKGLEDLQRSVESLGYQATLNGPYEKKGENCREEYRLRTIDCSLDLVRLPRKRKRLQ